MNGELDVIDVAELIATLIQALEKLGFEVTLAESNGGERPCREAIVEG